MTGQLYVDADLRLERGGDTFAVWSDGNRVVVNAPSLSALRHTRSLLGALPPGLLSGRGLPDRTPPIELRVRHATIARIDPDDSGTPGVEELLGVDATVTPRGVLAAAVRAMG